MVAFPMARWHRVVPLPAPRLATGETAESQPASAQNAMYFDGLEKVAGAGRLKPTAASWAAQPREHRRDRPLVKTDEKTDDRDHQGARIERGP